MPKLYTPLTKGAAFNFFINSIQDIGLGETEEHNSISGDGYLCWDTIANKIKWVNHDNLPSNGNNFRIVVSYNPPADPIEGLLWYDTFNHSLKVYVNANWEYDLPANVNNALNQITVSAEGLPLWNNASWPGSGVSGSGNIDGGSPDSIYLPSQHLDGGEIT